MKKSAERVGFFLEKGDWEQYIYRPPNAAKRHYSAPHMIFSLDGLPLSKLIYVACVRWAVENKRNRLRKRREKKKKKEGYGT